MTKNSILCILLAAITASTNWGCERLSVKDTLEGEEYELVDQFNREVTFPERFAGNVMLVGYVYTHCPDICPAITYNMRDIHRAYPDQDNLMLVSVTFDPERDSPGILREYAENYQINQKRWAFLTGGKDEVETLLEKLEIKTVKTPTRFAEDNTPVYFIDHTDRVTLIDREGRIRKHYTGSELNPDEVIKDIDTLLQES